MNDDSPTEQNEVEHLKALLAEAEKERNLLRGMMEKMFTEHMKWGVINPDGTTEMMPCADWCYACKLEKAQAEAKMHEAEAQAAEYGLRTHRRMLEATPRLLAEKIREQLVCSCDVYARVNDQPGVPYEGVKVLLKDARSKLGFHEICYWGEAAARLAESHAAAPGPRVAKGAAYSWTSTISSQGVGGMVNLPLFSPGGAIVDMRLDWVDAQYLMNCLGQLMSDAVATQEGDSQ